MSTRFVFPSLILCGLALLLCPLGRAQQMATDAAGAAPVAPKDPASQKISEAIVKMHNNDGDGALASLTQAIQLNPKNPAAYVLRASIYCEKKQWTQAEQDFNSAIPLAPTNVVLKLNLVEVKFMQKQYDTARAGYIPLVKDPDMGDFAAYKIFLCDLVGGHEALAAKELAAFNQVGGNPSYFFSNAAWSLVHKNIDDARGWLSSASHIYPLSKNRVYAQSLRDLGYLPIPQPKTE